MFDNQLVHPGEGEYIEYSASFGYHGTQIWFNRHGCGAQALKLLPMFRGHFSRKRNKFTLRI